MVYVPCAELNWKHEIYVVSIRLLMHYTLFIYIRTLSFLPRLNIFIFSRRFKDENILELFLIINHDLWHFRSCRLVKRITFLRLSWTHKLYGIYKFSTHKIESFLNSQPRVYSKIFFKFRIFQPRYSYKTYSYRKKKEVLQTKINYSSIMTSLISATCFWYFDIIGLIFMSYTRLVKVTVFSYNN